MAIGKHRSLTIIRESRNSQYSRLAVGYYILIKREHVETKDAGSHPSHYIMHSRLIPGACVWSIRDILLPFHFTVVLLSTERRIAVSFCAPTCALRLTFSNSERFCYNRLPCHTNHNATEFSHNPRTRDTFCSRTTGFLNSPILSPPRRGDDDELSFSHLSQPFRPYRPRIPITSAVVHLFTQPSIHIQVYWHLLVGAHSIHVTH